MSSRWTAVCRGRLNGVALGIVLTVQVASAQTPTGTQSAPATVAVATERAPLVDGVVLGDPAWADAPTTSGFRQTQPDEGEPASERTEVRVIFTETTLYVGVVCYDRDAQSITVSGSRRDSSLDDGDSIQIILDTFRDQQSGFVFGTSPAGQEYDGQVVDAGEGRVGRSTTTSSGSGAGFNRNWDGAWEVRTTVSDIGWTAEFAIPFGTISYPAREEQTLGFQSSTEHPSSQRDRVLGAVAPSIQLAQALVRRAAVWHSGTGGLEA